ncbi:MAG: Sigma factor RpoE negative regulatory protein RseB precursor [uncultured Thiotrichaceae bacterium]|uniref:Sigma factor RpoE negative regulatory protein RseB n=1 Tax=uncultured Thiotrichaceae bacterium TaxID=298394 RepID=A0A6S6TQJ3_9GAMM|nr:MAG: Sigma factor RpoE negative regulatory protein RseB precursor [uncultured Thiotrichaceae bacterium]
MNKNFVLSLLLTGVGVLTPQVWANDAVVLLNQMHNALHQLEYEGRLVYLKDEEVSTLSISHRLDNGAEKEVIIPLDQNGDKFIRESQSFSLAALPKINADMKAVYSFNLGGMSRVAGRECRIVLARPKDRKRYLQKFCIDKEHGLLLRYSLISQKHKPVERFMFTDIVIIDNNAAADESLMIPVEDVTAMPAPATSMAQPVMKASRQSLTPELSAASLSTDGTSLAMSMENAVESTPTSWFFDPLPAGFKLLNYPKSNIADGEEHIVLSDGLSAVSVFIGKNPDEAQVAHPAIRSGALNILTRQKNGFQVTMVGEVPEETLVEIFTGLRYLEK